jgi:hypothetical protein
MRNMNIEGFTENVHDHGESIQCFIKIEGTSSFLFSIYFWSLVQWGTNLTMQQSLQNSLWGSW